jgi:hypothetical protein
MNAPKSSTTLSILPRGLSFELSDLTLVLGWSEFHDMRMVVELDHCTGDEEYEEVLAFYPKSGSWMIACVGRIGRTVGDGPIAASASASPNG